MVEYKYYAAYGSNLNIEQMKMRCPGAKVVGRAIIFNYELLFRGTSKNHSYLTIEPSKGSRVPVAIWKINEKNEQALDFYEGYPRIYIKENFKLTMHLIKNCKKTKIIEAFVYIMDDDNNYIEVPSDYYLNSCLKGYDYFEFDKKILMNAYNKSLTKHKIKICPKCKKSYEGYPALSRIDNKTEICPECGLKEALVNFNKYEQNEILKHLYESSKLH